MMFTAEAALVLLNAAKVFFEDEDDELPPRSLNLNDTFWWGCADTEQVPEEAVPEVAMLFWRYGWNGILYWVAQRRGTSGEFLDVQRAVEFVRQEEALRQRVPRSSTRAYTRLVYTLGEDAPRKGGQDEHV